MAITISAVDLGLPPEKGGKLNLGANAGFEWRYMWDDQGGEHPWPEKAELHLEIATADGFDRPFIKNGNDFSLCIPKSEAVLLPDRTEFHLMFYPQGKGDDSCPPPRCLLMGVTKRWGVNFATAKGK